MIPRTSRRCFSTVFQRWSCGKAHAAWWCKFRRQTKPLPACPSCTTFPEVGPPAQGWPSGNKAAYADCIASYSPRRPISAGVLRNIKAEHQNLCMECLMCTCWRSDGIFDMSPLACLVRCVHVCLMTTQACNLCLCMRCLMCTCMRPGWYF